jgi:hypothetical protein
VDDNNALGGGVVADTTFTFGAIAAAWECPRCGIVNAPFITQCTCSRAGLAEPYPFLPGTYEPYIVPDPYIAPGPGPTWPGLGGGTFSACAPGCVALNGNTTACAAFINEYPSNIAYGPFE